MDFKFALRWARLMACSMCCGCAVTEYAIDGSRPLHPQRVDLVEVSLGGSPIDYSFFPRARVNLRESAKSAGGLQTLALAFSWPARSARDGTINFLPVFPGCRAVRVLVPQSYRDVTGDERELVLRGSTALDEAEPLNSLRRYRVKLSDCDALAYIEVPRPGTTDLVLVSHASEIARISVDDAGEFDPSLIPTLPLSVLFDVVTLPVQVVVLVWWFFTW